MKNSSLATALLSIAANVLSTDAIIDKVISDLTKFKADKSLDNEIQLFIGLNVLGEKLTNDFVKDTSEVQTKAEPFKPAVDQSFQGFSEN